MKITITQPSEVKIDIKVGMRFLRQGEEYILALVDVTRVHGKESTGHLNLISLRDGCRWTETVTTPIIDPQVAQPESVCVKLFTMDNIVFGFYVSYDNKWYPLICG